MARLGNRQYPPALAWTLVNSTSITSALAPFSIAVTNEDLMIVVSDVSCSGSEEVAFSTNSGSSYSGYIFIAGDAAGSSSYYDNMVLTGLKLGSIRMTGSGSNGSDTTNPQTDSITSTLIVGTFNPGASVTNVKIGCSGTYSAGGTINTYGRN
jgi:hypothetical protein